MGNLWIPQIYIIIWHPCKVSSPDKSGWTQILRFWRPFLSPDSKTEVLYKFSANNWCLAGLEPATKRCFARIYLFKGEKLYRWATGIMWSNRWDLNPWIQRLQLCPLTRLGYCCMYLMPVGFEPTTTRVSPMLPRSKIGSSTNWAMTSCMMVFRTSEYFHAWSL